MKIKPPICILKHEGVQTIVKLFGITIYHKVFWKSTDNS